MIFRHWMIFDCALAALVVVVSPANAAMVTLNLTGDTSSLSISNNALTNYDWSQGIIYLTNTATGTNQIPGFTLSPGDTITGTVTLNDSLTVPSGDTLTNISVYPGTGTPYMTYYEQYVTFYNNGMQVLPPTGYTVFGGSSGALVLGGQAYNPSPTVTPSVTFDEIIFNAYITGIWDNGLQQYIPSETFPDGTPGLSYSTLNAVTPVPAPGSYVLLLSGFVLLGGLAFRKKSAITEDIAMGC